MYFFSIWTANINLNFQVLKPILVFLGTYILGELAVRYKLSPAKNWNKRGSATLIF